MDVNVALLGEPSGNKQQASPNQTASRCCFGLMLWSDLLLRIGCHVKLKWSKSHNFHLCRWRSCVSNNTVGPRLSACLVEVKSYSCKGDVTNDADNVLLTAKSLDEFKKSQVPTQVCFCWVFTFSLCPSFTYLLPKCKNVHNCQIIKLDSCYKWDALLKCYHNQYTSLLSNPLLSNWLLKLNCFLVTVIRQD